MPVDWDLVLDFYVSISSALSSLQKLSCVKSVIV